MLRSRIVGTGSYLPEKVVTNDELSKIVETSDAWIRKQTGIGARHIAAWKNHASYMLFNDGTNAMVMTAEKRPDRGLLSTHLHTDGTKTSILCIPGGGSAKPFTPAVFDAREHYVKMNGREVYKVAV